MAYETVITAPDGSDYVFESDHEPTPQEQSELAGHLATELESTGQSKAIALGNAFMRGGAQSAASAVEGIGDLTSIDFLSKTGKDLKESAAYQFPVDPNQEENFSTKAAGAVGQGVEQALELAVPVAKLGAASKAVKAIGYGSAFVKGADSGEDTARQYGLEDDPLKRYGLMLGFGALEAGTEMIGGLGPEKALGELLGGEALSEVGKRAVIKGGITEYAEEYLNQVGQNALVRSLVSEEDAKTLGMRRPDYLEDANESGLLGGIAGMAMSSPRLFMAPHVAHAEQAENVAQATTERTEGAGAQTAGVVAGAETLAGEAGPMTEKVSSDAPLTQARDQLPADTSGSQIMTDSMAGPGELAGKLEERGQVETPLPGTQDPQARGKEVLAQLAGISGSQLPQVATESIIDGTFNGDFRGAGTSTLEIDENDNVVLRRFANDDAHMTKEGQTSAGAEDLWNTSETHGGGNGVPTIGSSRDTSGVAKNSYAGYAKEGVFRIPVSDFLSLAQSGEIILGNIGESEVVISPAVAQKYLTESNQREQPEAAAPVSSVPVATAAEVVAPPQTAALPRTGPRQLTGTTLAERTKTGDTITFADGTTAEVVASGNGSVTIQSDTHGKQRIGPNQKVGVALEPILPASTEELSSAPLEQGERIDEPTAQRMSRDIADGLKRIGLKTGTDVVFLNDGEALPNAEHAKHVPTMGGRGLFYAGQNGANNTIYLNRDRITKDTPVHELLHGYAPELRRQRPDVYRQGVELLETNREYLDAVRKHYPELSGEALYDEALVSLLGNEGRELWDKTSKSKPLANKFRKFTARVKLWLDSKLRPLGISGNMTVEQWAKARNLEIFSGKKTFNEGESKGGAPKESLDPNKRLDKHAAKVREPFFKAYRAAMGVPPSVHKTVGVLQAEMAAGRNAKPGAKPAPAQDTGIYSQPGTRPITKPVPNDSTVASTPDILSAYNRLVNQSGTPSVYISDLAKESGTSIPAMHRWLTENVINKGLGSVDEGDWSSSNEDERAAAIMLRDRERLYVSLRPEAFGPKASVDTRLQDDGETSKLQDNDKIQDTGGVSRAPQVDQTDEGGLRDGGRLSGSPVGVESQSSAPAPGTPLTNLPGPVNVPGRGKVAFGPFATAQKAAQDYVESTGRVYNPPTAYAKVDKERATRIAAEYEAMEHAPNDPAVAASFRAMVDETLAQWEFVKKTGLKVEAIRPGMEDPYAATPRLAVLDAIENNHLWFFPTVSGFGGSESAGVDITGNPLMEPTGEVLNGHKMLANDVFRVVHDYFGHIKEGVGFRADGEENAWRSHASMYSDLARPAMTTETRGQNSWVNYGPFAEFNQTASGSDTQYAPQKTGLMAPWTSVEGSGTETSPAPKASVSVPPKNIRMKPPKGVTANTTEGLPTWNVEKGPDSLPKVLSNQKGRDQFYKRLDGALEGLRKKPEAILTPAGWVNFLRKAGVWGEIPMPPTGLTEVITDPAAYVAKLNGGYHGANTIPGTQESAQQGLDGTVEMRELIGEGNAPPKFAVALHHMWGILSRMLPPLQQEGMWLRLISHRPVLDTIQSSIDGKFDTTLEEWKGIVADARNATTEAGVIGNAGTANANSFYAMLARLNGRWQDMADVYAAPDSRKMGRLFWDVGAGALGIKNKVQRFIGLTFGVPGVIMDRWKFVEFWLPTAMEGTGAATTSEYFDYGNNTPSDPVGIYGVYGTVDSDNEALSLAMYEAFETVLESAIAKSPELRTQLGKHTNAGGMHWHGWNAIKNEAVGHSSLDLTKDLVKKHGLDFNAEQVEDALQNGTYYTEGAETQQSNAKVILDRGKIRVERTGVAGGLQPGRAGVLGQGDGANAAGVGQGSESAAGDSQSVAPKASVDTKATDAEYMAAVESGDVEKQQAMVDAAAKAAGYDIRGYHGTTAPEEFTEFIPNPALGGAVFVATDPEEANVFKGGNGRVMNVFLRVQNLRKGVVRSYDEVRAIAAAKKNGQDAIRVRDAAYGAINYAVFDPSQLKSAEPVTRDDQGDIIPLSQRFQTSLPDIRRSVDPVMKPTGLARNYLSRPGAPQSVREAFDTIEYESERGVDAVEEAEAIYLAGRMSNWGTRDHIEHLQKIADGTAPVALNLTWGAYWGKIMEGLIAVRNNPRATIEQKGEALDRIKELGQMSAIIAASHGQFVKGIHFGLRTAFPELDVEAAEREMQWANNIEAKQHDAALTVIMNEVFGTQLAVIKERMKDAGAFTQDMKKALEPLIRAEDTADAGEATMEVNSGVRDHEVAAARNGLFDWIPDAIRALQGELRANAMDYLRALSVKDAIRKAKLKFTGGGPSASVDPDADFLNSIMGGGRDFSGMTLAELERADKAVDKELKAILDRNRKLGRKFTKKTKKDPASIVTDEEKTDYAAAEIARSLERMVAGKKKVGKKTPDQLVVDAIIKGVMSKAGIHVQTSQDAADNLVIATGLLLQHKNIAAAAMERAQTTLRNNPATRDLITDGQLRAFGQLVTGEQFADEPGDGAPFGFADVAKVLRDELRTAKADMRKIVNDHSLANRTEATLVDQLRDPNRGFETRLGKENLDKLINEVTKEYRRNLADRAKAQQKRDAVRDARRAAAKERRELEAETRKALKEGMPPKPRVPKVRTAEQLAEDERQKLEDERNDQINAAGREYAAHRARLEREIVGHEEAAFGAASRGEIAQAELETKHAEAARHEIAKQPGWLASRFGLTAEEAQDVIDGTEWSEERKDAAWLRENLAEARAFQREQGAGKRAQEKAIRKATNEPETVIDWLIRRHRLDLNGLEGIFDDATREEGVEAVVAKLVTSLHLSPEQAKRFVRPVVAAAMAKLGTKRRDAVKARIKAATETKAKRRPKATELEKIIKLAEMGGLDVEGFSDIVLGEAGKHKFTESFKAELVGHLRRAADKSIPRVESVASRGEFARRIEAARGVSIPKLYGEGFRANMFGGFNTQKVNFLFGGVKTWLDNWAWSEAVVRASPEISKDAGVEPLTRQQASWAKRGMLRAALRAMGKWAQAESAYILKTGLSNIDDDASVQFSGTNLELIREFPERMELRWTKNGKPVSANAQKLNYTWFKFHRYVRRAMVSADIFWRATAWENIKYGQAVQAIAAMNAENRPKTKAEFYKKMDEINYGPGGLEAALADANAKADKAVADKIVDPSRRGIYVQELLNEQMGKAHGMSGPQRLVALREESKRFTLASKSEGVLGNLTDIAITASSKVPFFGLFVPAIRVPINAMFQNLDWTPWGFVRAWVGESSGGKYSSVSTWMFDRDGTLKFAKPAALITSERIMDLRVKALVGSSMSLVFLALMKAAIDDDDDKAWFYINAKGPSDPEEFRNFKARGLMPYTIRLGGLDFNYRESPLYAGLAWIGALSDAFRYGKPGDTNDEKFMAAAASTMRAFSDQAVLTSMQDALGIVSGGSTQQGDPGTVLKKISARILSTAIAPNVGRDVNTILYGPGNTKEQAWAGNVLENFPLVPALFRQPAINALGDEIHEHRGGPVGEVLPSMGYRIATRPVDDPQLHLVAHLGINKLSTSKNTKDGREVMDDYDLVRKWAKASGAEIRKYLTPERMAALEALRKTNLEKAEKDFDKVVKEIRDRELAKLIK